ncbi:MAG TPA: molybdopterin-dependent oxidoreductase [Candidatus Aquilonibacter sp.]
MNRRLFVASSISSALAACSPIGTALNNNAGVHKFLGSAQGLTHAVVGTRGLAREYPASAISADFPVDSLPTPTDANYMELTAHAFRGFKLVVDGAVEKRQVIPLEALAHMQQTTQITRHDCVEGWSVVAKWSGVRLSNVLDLVQPRKDARYVVFHCMDKDDQGTPYYESLDMHEARHPQALLALRMNDRVIPPEHGAPVRLKIPTQLGYKSAKWIKRIEVVGSIANIYQGGGGYWEDQGYEWYAGI